MRVIKLHQGYKEQVKELYEFTFEKKQLEKLNYILDVDDFWNNSYGVINEENNLVAVHSLNKTEFFIRNFEVNSLFGLFVGTNPAERNQGAAKQLFMDAIRQCQEDNIPIFMFSPFKHSYYKRWGCETGTNEVVLQFDFDFLAKDNVKIRSKIVMGKLKSNKYIQELYRKSRRQFVDTHIYNEINLPLYLEDSWLFNTENLVAISMSELGRPNGFINYRVESRKLIIDLIRFESIEVFYNLKKFISSYRDQVDHIYFESIPEDFPFEILIEDYWKLNRVVRQMVFPAVMLRIVNVKKLLENILELSPLNKISLKIIDELIEENNNIFTITTDGRVMIKNNIKPNISINIRDFTCVITGRFSVKELYYQERIKVTSSNQSPIITTELPPELVELERLFPKKITFFPERI